MATISVAHIVHIYTPGVYEDRGGFTSFSENALRYSNDPFNGGVIMMRPSDVIVFSCFTSVSFFIRIIGINQTKKAMFMEDA